MIPEAAVEAAAIAWSGPLEWLAHSDEWRDDRLEDARAALEAAAPHMLAQELEKVAQDLEESAQIIQVRSHDSGIDNEATVHAMNTDADVLRARAAIYRPAK